MASLREIDKKLFPLQNVGAVIQIFRGQLEAEDADLALLSIIAGAVENSLTNRSAQSGPSDASDSHILPILELGTVQTLYAKFHAILRGAIDLSEHKGVYATRDIVKKVSDVIWNTLTRGYYKDRPHLQSLYSYLTGNKLDCFGVAFAVVAGCQALGFKDVHLTLSEDHAWVVFGENGAQTSEVTWHGKGTEDKRGLEITKGVTSRSWLYVNNKPVICTRAMEVAALVSAINPSLTATHDALEIILLQQELLWLLYDMGHLAKYPMAIGNLGDLEEICPTPGRIPCTSLFQEAILSSRTFYDNQHVYPYTYQGGYFYRNKMYQKALESWANASDVIRKYNYSRADEEIYKEFLEIANELIPHIMKVESSGFSSNSVLKKPECFANLLRFYDGICQWEEGSATPVLHIGWAKPLVNTISKFDADVRSCVDITCAEEQNKKSTAVFQQQNKNGSSSTTNLKQTNCVINNNNNLNLHPSIEALTAGCSAKILNREFLLQGGGSPFVGCEEDLKKPNIKKIEVENEKAGPSVDSSKIEVEEEEKKVLQDQDCDDEMKYEIKRPKVVLHSKKMKELKDLLLAEKLNTHAISLHLTAQSQVQFGKKRGTDVSSEIKSNSSSTNNASNTTSTTSASTTQTRPKRTRRD